MTENCRFLSDPMRIDFEKAEFARLNHLHYPVSSVREACSRPIGFQNVVAEPATSQTPENLLETPMTGPSRVWSQALALRLTCSQVGAPASERGEGEDSAAVSSERAVRCTRCTVLGPGV